MEERPRTKVLTLKVPMCSKMYNKSAKCSSDQTSNSAIMEGKE